MSKYHIHMGAAVIFLLLTGAVAGCTKGFDKLAADPARPSDAPVSALMNTIASAMQNDGSEYTFLFNELYTPLSELNGSSKRLGVDAVSRSNAPLWTRYYHMMKNVRDAEQKIRSYKGDTDVYVNVKAVMKIMTAQVTLRTVNFFGDIPFSQAGYAFSGPQQVLQPRYDAQQDIYTQALADLQWASEHLQLESGATTASGEPLQPVSANIDPYFGGNLLSWKAFANGLRLRYALLLSDVAPQQATAIIT
ncbi:MAG TPA: SusD/RagB family nutrient-binding outer membrane lipoprotein, partial [Chitinophaga sp.]